MTYLDVWRSGTFLLCSCKAAFWTQEMSPRLSDVDRSVVLRSVFAISSALAWPKAMSNLLAKWAVKKSKISKMGIVMIKIDY